MVLQARWAALQAAALLVVVAPVVARWAAAQRAVALPAAAHRAVVRWAVPWVAEPQAVQPAGWVVRWVAPMPAVAHPVRWVVRRAAVQAAAAVHRVAVHRATAAPRSEYLRKVARVVAAQEHRCPAWIPVRAAVVRAVPGTRARAARTLQVVQAAVRLQMKAFSRVRVARPAHRAPQAAAVRRAAGQTRRTAVAELLAQQVALPEAVAARRVAPVDPQVQPAVLLAAAEHPVQMAARQAQPAVHRPRWAVAQQAAVARPAEPRARRAVQQARVAQARMVTRRRRWVAVRPEAVVMRVQPVLRRAAQPDRAVSQAAVHREAQAMPQPQVATAPVQQDQQDRPTAQPVVVTTQQRAPGAPRADPAPTDKAARDSKVGRLAVLLAPQEMRTVRPEADRTAVRRSRCR